MSSERKQILEMLAKGKISIDEAERLLNALGNEDARESMSINEREASAQKGKPKYFRVLVEPKNGNGDKVNIKIPLQVIRAGVKLKSILPDSTKTKVNTALGDKGFNFDIDDVNSDSIDEIISSLSDLGIEVDDDKEKVSIFCE